MSREIKFRAWSPLAREMYKVNSLHFDKEGLSEIVVEVFEVDGVIYSSAVARNLELMQYTGVKDENDKEIYEGDIVHLPGTHQLGIVKWNTSKPEYYVYGKDGGLIDYALHGDWKIIGNIYEDVGLCQVDV